MALYRNIAGFGQMPHQMGLTLLPPVQLPRLSPGDTSVLQDALNIDIYKPPTTQVTQPEIPTGGALNTTPILTPQDILNNVADQQAVFETLYNTLLSMSLYDITKNGFFVDADASVQQCTDPTHSTCKIVLPLQEIQRIENNRGTAGTLFMHFNLPLLAKDTAGYAGGAQASDGATTVYSPPIDEVASIPNPPGGPNVINDYTNPVPTTPTYTPNDGTTNAPGSNTTQTPASSTPTGNVLSMATVAGLAVIAIAGEALLKKRTRIVFIGGLGLLYYSMKANKI